MSTVIPKPAHTAVPINPLATDRWSGRAYDADRRVSHDDLTGVLEAARWAPSCMNLQPWRIIICDRHTDPDAWEMAFDALEWVLIGAIELIVLAIVLGGLERLQPAEAPAGRRAWRTDVIYALLRRLGLVPLLAFVLFTPLVDAFEAHLRLLGLSRLSLDGLWPGVSEIGRAHV